MYSVVVEKYWEEMSAYFFNTLEEAEVFVKKVKKEEYMEITLLDTNDNIIKIWEK